MNNTSKPEIELSRDTLVQQYHELASLAGGLAHEVKNPLSTIRLNLELLLEDMQTVEHPNAQRMLRKLKTIQNECGHVEDVLDAFLQFARVGELSLEQCNLSQVILQFLEVNHISAKQDQVEIRSHLAADLPDVLIDRRLFRQVLENLVRNAQQALPTGGIIEIQAYSSSGEVVVEIIDNGTGIKPELLPKIFDEFFSTKNTGSGLGLPTVRKIIRSHHGSISCESELDHGTKFTIRLPIFQNQLDDR